MQDIRYHSVQPMNKKDTYTDFDNVDFLISAVGRKVVGGSVRLVGDVTVYPTGTTTQLSETVAYDGLTGSHSWFSSIVTSCSSVGQIENLNFFLTWLLARHVLQLLVRLYLTLIILWKIECQILA
jgi:hypothetical protein